MKNEQKEKYFKFLWWVLVQGTPLLFNTAKDICATQLIISSKLQY